MLQARRETEEATLLAEEAHLSTLVLREERDQAREEATELQWELERLRRGGPAGWGEGLRYARQEQQRQEGGGIEAGSLAFAFATAMQEVKRRRGGWRLQLNLIRT